ncbi:hypothetical protein DL98DRAFT_592915 [Cadophora sp. DSE1049]|nr:hypothetical protein DL98DRAFT_592915 [Cadophora sp. DSE1049]
MAASNAPVSWQIDIPSLSQLIVNVGAYGLKQLALAGVDVHSIGCLLLISNSTPTRMEYRQELNKQRSLERSERKWFFTVVEVGAASNFLVDELLKTRAGENVLALMSALIPHLEESVLPRVLMETFEHFKIPAESTPGMGQLSKVRAALAAYVGRMDFKDRVLLRHRLFSNLNSAVDFNPSISIPEAAILPKIISLLYKVTVSDELVLHVSGFRGAAWVATYATHVLGLDACTVLADGEVLALTASYEKSKVVFFINSAKSEITLWKEHEIEELISISIQDQGLSRWLVDCDKVNFFQFHCPDMKGQMAESMSHFVTAKSFEAIEARIFDTAGPKDVLSKYNIYMRAFAPQIQERAVGIVRTLGFSPESVDFYQQRILMTQRKVASIQTSKTPTASRTMEDGRRYFDALFWTCREAHSDNSSFSIPSSPFSKQSQDQKFSMESLFIHFAIQVSSMEGTKGNLSEQDIPRGLLHVLNNAAEFASLLAFTDWNHGNRSISTEFFRNQPLPQRKVGRLPSRCHFDAWQQHIMHRALEFSTNMTDKALEKKLGWVADWLGQNYDGIIVVRHLACSQDLLKLPGCLATFHPGHIAVDGERFQDFREEQDLLLIEQEVRQTQPRSKTYMPHFMTTIPDGPFFSSNMFPELRLQTMVETRRDSVWIKSHLLVDGTNVSLISPSRIASYATHLLISKPCDHEDVSRPLSRAAPAAGANSLFKWSAGLVLNKNVILAENTPSSAHGRPASTSTSTLPPVQVHIQQVDNNRLGQWVSVHARDHGRDVTCMQILQRDSCLDCIIDRLPAIEHTNSALLLIIIILNTGSATSGSLN